MDSYRPSQLIALITATFLVVGCGSATPTTTTSPLASTAPAASVAADELPPMADVPFYRVDTTAHGIQPGPGPTGIPQLAWRVNVGETHMVPILVGGALIVGTNDGRVVSLDAHTGQKRWVTQAGSGAIQPTLAAVDGEVFASDGSAIIAVDLATGAKRWATPEDGATGRLIAVDGVVYDGFRGGVVGLDEETGKEVWRWDGPAGIQVNAGPIVDGVGYFATTDGRLYAVDITTGKAVWPSAVQSIGTTIASGQVVGDTVIVSNNQGDAAEPVGEIYAIDRSSGKVRWRFRSPSGLQIKEGPVKDGILYANGLQDGIYALRDGGTSASVVWQVHSPESHWPMALVGDTLYQARTDGSVGAYAIADGRLLWETPSEGNWTGGPIVSGGMVFVANDATGVMAFADPALIALLPKPVAQVSPSSSTAPQGAAKPFAVVRTFSWADTGLDTPLGMDPGPDGLLYILDVKPRVTVIDPTHGRVVRRWGRQGTGPGEFDVTRPDDNPGNGDIAVAPDGRVYVADGTNHRVQVFTPEGKFLFQFGSFGTGEGQFGAIENIETGPRGEVYAEDDHGLSKFTADGKFVWRSAETLHHFAVRADGQIVSNCEQCRQLLFVSPDTGRIVKRVGAPEMDGDGFGPVNLDAKDDIYVEVYRSESILAFDPDGKFIAGGYLQPGSRPAVIGRAPTFGDATWPTPVFMPDGRAFTFAEQGLVELKVTLQAEGAVANPFTAVQAFSWESTALKFPLGMDPGPDGMLYVFDTKPQVTVIDPKDGRVVRRWGRQGTGPGEFDVTRPDDNQGFGDIAVAPDGRVYVADGSNHRVQVFTPQGKFLFQFGSFGTKEGQFGSIDEVVAAPDGSIYVVEEGHWISKFRADGKFVWRAPTLNDPLSLAVRPDGVLLRPGPTGDKVQLLDPGDGKVRGVLDVPETGGGAGPINLDPSGNIYIVVFGGARPVGGHDTQDAELVYTKEGKFLGGRYIEAGMRHTAIGRTASYGDAYWPSPVFLPDGRAFTFGEAGLVELRVDLPTS